MNLHYSTPLHPHITSYFTSLPALTLLVIVSYRGADVITALSLYTRDFMVAPLYTTASGLLFHAGKILVVTVGLPARGKTHISRALERYLRWMGVKTQVVSLGDYRRKILGGTKKVPYDYFTLGMPTVSLSRYMISTNG
jgi:6-phosphofructo-2-kinase